MNKSTVFIRGLLGVKFKDYDDNYSETKVIIPDRICITYDGICKDEILLSHSDLIKKIDKENKVYLLFSADKWKEDINYFLNGSYRQMTYDAKTTIISCFTEGINKKRVISIFYPTLADIEGLSKFFNSPVSTTADIYDKPKKEEEILDVTLIEN